MSNSGSGPAGEQILDELFSEPIEADGLLADCLIREQDDPEPVKQALAELPAGYLREAEKAERFAKARDLLWGDYP
jgi:hypothetical protein